MNQVSRDVSKDLKYTLMPGKFGPGFPDVDLYNKTYQLWKTVWKDVFTEAGNPAALVADDFMRQDFICAIHLNREVIACHLYTFFNLEQNVALDHRYFSIFPPDVIGHFLERKATHLMSMEFLTVHPDWRKSPQLEAPLGPVLINLGINVVTALQGDAAIAPARKKTKVDQMAYRFGFDCLKPNVSRGNLDCDLIALFPQNAKTYPDLGVVNLAKNLWQNKQDLTGRIVSTDATTTKKAA